MIKEAIIKVAKKEDLTYEESKAVMNEIMDGETSGTDGGISDSLSYEG